MTWLGWAALCTPVVLLLAAAIGKSLKILDDDTPCTPADGDDDNWPFSDNTLGI